MDRVPKTGHKGGGKAMDLKPGAYVMKSDIMDSIDSCIDDVLWSSSLEEDEGGITDEQALYALKCLNSLKASVKRKTVFCIPGWEGVK